MPRTFEELIGSELDSLLTGALFLTGGHDGTAEELLLATLREAFHMYRRTVVEAKDAERWLEDCLAGRALVDLERVEEENSISTEPLYRESARIPVRPRVALWLVIMRRWSYEAAAQRLNVDRKALMELLQYREQLRIAIQPERFTSGNG